MSTKETVTSIAARGYVVSEYDTAKFTFTFSEYADKARDAKSKLKAGVHKVSAAIEGLRAKGLVMLSNSFHTSTSVQPNSVYDNAKHKHVIDGQKATYTVVFQTPTLDMVSEAYDVLSELDVNECTINSPTFFVRKVADLKQHALEDAWNVAQVLFNNQCKTLGVDSNNFSVSSWTVNYSGEDYSGFSKGRNYSNSAVANGGGVDDGAIDLVSGKALIEVILTVNYSRKPL